MVARGCRGEDPRAARDGSGDAPDRQAQADLHTQSRYGGPRHRGERGEDRHDREQAPRQDLSQAHGLSRRAQGNRRGRRDQEAPRSRDRRSRVGNASEGSARTGDVPQAQGVRRKGPSPRRAEAAPDRSRRVQVGIEGNPGGISLATNTNAAAKPRSAIIEYYGTGRRKRAVARVHLREGGGTLTVNRKAIETYFPNDMRSE